MTDEEYCALLKALAAKHLKIIGQRQSDAQQALERLSSTARILKATGDSGADQVLMDRLLKEFEPSPIDQAGSLMEEAGILDALDDARSLTFGEFRRSAIPQEDVELLRRAGFTDAEVEVLLAVAVEHAHILARSETAPSRVIGEAADALKRAVTSLRPPAPGAPAVTPDRKKRKILNGTGKLLQGAILGTGNVLLWTGTVLAPNPATGYAVIACGGLAVSSLFAGLGDLRGE